MQSLQKQDREISSKQGSPISVTGAPAWFSPASCPVGGLSGKAKVRVTQLSEDGQVEPNDKSEAGGGLAGRERWARGGWYRRADR